MTARDDSTPQPATHIETVVTHTGRDPFANHGFVNTPVYRGSTVLFRTLDAFESRQQKYVYGRRGSPTSDSLCEAIAALEGGTQTWVMPSGAAAIASVLLAFTKAGDHVLMVDSVYQPTRKMCEGLLKRFGVETTYYEPLIGADIARLMRPNTTLVFTESPGSLTFEIQDIAAIAAAAHAKGAVVAIDNTWSGGVYFKAFAHGVDLSIQAATKYIVGHADAMLGSVTAADPAIAARLVNETQALGICAGTEEMYLGLRGLRTIEVRMQRHWQSGVEVARWLEARPEVARVLHPALESHPQHRLWKRDFTGASGLFAVELKLCTRTQLAAFLDGLRLFGMGASWGGFESLIIPFNAAASRTATAWAPQGPTLRLHIGLEAVPDILADLDAGLARLKAAG
ncbi:MAG: cystathionine beta-lyase [Hyphomicrobiaceae bacterium]|nr:cystathionine beta-lyase [Hyphomicrobiaceae bacterium]